MRILITGAGGQLGRELQRALLRHELQSYSHGLLDITDREAVDSAVTSFSPQVIVHAAALTDTALCESNVETAIHVNADGAENVAYAAASFGASMVYVSTNEVFDGRKTKPYVEADTTGPLNAYARSKLEGERRVQQALPRHYLVRTAWLYGQGGNNFVAKVLKWAEAGRVIGVTDEIATPTWTRSLARAIAKLIETERYGTYHLSNGGETSRYFWATEILRLAGRTDIDVEPLTTAAFRAAIPGDVVVPEKPAYSVLANTNAKALGIDMLFWQEALARFVSGNNET